MIMLFAATVTITYGDGIELASCFLPPGDVRVSQLILKMTKTQPHDLVVPGHSQTWELVLSKSSVFTLTSHKSWFPKDWNCTSRHRDLIPVDRLFSLALHHCPVPLKRACAAAKGSGPVDSF